jgi:hypothetical protein
MNKKLFLLPAFILGAFLAVTTTSCGDNCKDVECNTGTCVDGTCECGDGYEGTNCEIEWSAKFLGSYLGTDVVTGGTAGNEGTYNLNAPAVITKINETTIRITNFGGFGSVLDATIDRPATSTASATELTINSTDPGGRDFVGSASISGNTLTGSYTVTYDDGTTDIATFTYTK